MATSTLLAAHFCDPFLSTSIDTIEEIQRSKGDDFGPILSLLREISARGQRPHLVPHVTAEPPFFPQRQTLYIKITNLIWLLAELIQKDWEVCYEIIASSSLATTVTDASKHRALWLQTVDAVYRLYSYRVFGVVGFQGRYERKPEQASDFARYMKPVNYLAHHMYVRCMSNATAGIPDEVAQFLWRQLRHVLTHRL
ncbi:unnamed protein product [Peniophora sp. CBMAI 1063]|nr:unnamed protein product [Peniophora sp. CBMAI 1063]